mmetsp:Transcript_28295/g.36602  ORF Transcript_28295/g.36602 Transcript_28295/m.36602 type:complete len:450 (+) Transcript_28295:61-1410(+)
MISENTKHIFYLVLILTLVSFTQSIDTVGKCHYVAWKKETICDEITTNELVQNEKHNDKENSQHIPHQHHISQVNIHNKLSSSSEVPILSQSPLLAHVSHQIHDNHHPCNPFIKRGLSTLINQGRAMLLYHSTDISASDENAHKWWNCSVIHAIKDSPPQPGKSTLVFIHVPKVGGTSLESVFDKLTEIRKPLCSRRFMDSFDKKPSAVHKSVKIKGCSKNVSNLLWGHLSLDLSSANKITGNPNNGFRPPPMYSMMLLRNPFERLVSFANYMGVSQSEFEKTWAKQLSANTMTSMINGLKPLGVLNRNRFSGEDLSCFKNRDLAVKEARTRLLVTFTFVGTTELYEASLWMLQQVFGWGEAIILDSLLHPSKGFRTKHATQAHIIPFKHQDVSIPVKEFILKKEYCDGQVHEFASDLVKSRLRAMSPTYHQLFREFERKLQMGGSRGH